MHLNPQVALIQMPFASVFSPSLGLSLLKSGLALRGVSSKVFYFNLRYAQTIGFELYDEIANGSPGVCDLLGEWIFSEALWGVNPENDREYFQQIIRGGDPAHRKNVGAKVLDRCCSKALEARSKVSSFLDTCISEVNWAAIQIVGFTSVFQQHLASLAMAKRLKQKYPHLFVIVGGANCEAEMGKITFDHFPFLDAVCSGEGDYAFPQFAELLLAGKRPEIEGILTRYDRANHPSLPDLVQIVHSVPPVNNLDSLPYPDYHDFFETVEFYAEMAFSKCRLLFETSRGCWWGQKHHCTFCGLNGLGMSFRCKTADRALGEIQYLLNTYGHFTTKLSAADNIIPLEYFHTLLPQLEELHLDLDLFYETKANLTESQVAQYRRSGLGQIQPGIESLNSSVLKLMRKGVSALQNIQLLKWCAQYGIYPHWNYLFGFPGESPDSYNSQAELLTKMRHLTPPQGSAPVRFDRFSPYHSSPDAFGIVSLAPYPAYSYVYRGLSQEMLPKLAYYFVGEFKGADNIESYTSDIVKTLEEWCAIADRVTLCHSTTAGEQTVVFDTRDPERLRVYVLQGVYSQVFERCASTKAVRTLASELHKLYCSDQIQKALENLVGSNLLISEEERFLTLSIPLGFYYVPPDAALQRISAYLKCKDEAVNNCEVHIPSEICTIMQ